MFRKFNYVHIKGFSVEEKVVSNPLATKSDRHPISHLLDTRIKDVITSSSNFQGRQACEH